MKFTFYLLAFAFSVSGCIEQPKVQPESDQHPEEVEIRDFLNQYYQTMSSRQWSAYRGFFWDKATLTTIWATDSTSAPTVQISTIDEFISKTGEGPDSQPIFEESMTSVDIQIKKNLAQAWATYDAKFGNKEELMEWSGMDLFSLMKHEGEWKIVSLAFSSD